MVLRKQVAKETLGLSLLNEPRHEKSRFCIFENEGADELCVDQLIRAFIFNLNTVQSHFLLNSNFQAYSHLLCLYSTVQERIQDFWIGGSNSERGFVILVLPQFFLMKMK